LGGFKLVEPPELDMMGFQGRHGKSTYTKKLRTKKKPIRCSEGHKNMGQWFQRGAGGRGVTGEKKKKFYQVRRRDTT